MKIWKDKITEKEIEKLFTKSKKRIKVPEDLNERFLHLIHNQPVRKDQKKLKFNFKRIVKPAIALSVILFAVISLQIFLFTSKDLKENISRSMLSVGNVIYIRNGHSHQLAGGIKLIEQDKIITNKYSKCQIQTAENNAILLINENTVLSLKKLQTKKDKSTLLFLERGKLYVKVRKFLKENKFQVITDNGIITIKGTEFIVESFPGKKTIVAVKEGKVKTESINSPQNAVIIGKKESVLIKDAVIQKRKMSDNETEKLFKNFGNITERSFENEEESGKLDLEIEDGASQIIIGDKIKEETDKISLLLKPKKYVIFVYKPGFESFKQEIVINKNDFIHKKIKLQKISNNQNIAYRKKDLRYFINKFGIFPFKLIAEYNHRYFISSQKMRWYEALKECKKYGGYLVTITTQKESIIINKAIQENNIEGSIWIGASDQADEGDWKWVTGERFKFSDWDYMEPNNGQLYMYGKDAFAYENYAVILNKDGNLKWSDIKNVDSQFFIMEIGK